MIYTMEAVLNFGRRKIQKVRYSRLVPLPPAWVRENAAHGEVEVLLLESGELLIKPVKPVEG
jgi:hypothetical protein